MKLKRLHFVDVAEIQEAIIDELKRSKKRNFRSFSETVQLCKSLYIHQWSLFWIKKKYVSSSCVFDF